MSETNKLIMKLMIHNRSINEIARLIKLSPKQVFQRIKQIQNQGYSFDENYYSDGEIRYTPNNTVKKNNSGVPLYTYQDDNILKTVIISDLHIGSENENLKAINMIFDYCAKKDIHIILNAGDFVNGNFGKAKNIIIGSENQAEYLAKKYPYDKSILTLTVLGDHDFSLLRKDHFDLMSFLQNHRHDIIPIGFANGTIKVKNDSIRLSHPVRQLDKKIQYENDSSITIFGHQHRTAIKSSHNKLTIGVTSLSQILRDDIDIHPGAIAMDITFRYGAFESATLKQLIISDKIYEANKMMFEIRTNEETEDFKKIKTVYEAPKTLKKTL